MKYVLIVIMLSTFTNLSNSQSSSYFGSLEACENASNDIKNVFQGFGVKLYARCFPTGIVSEAK